MFVAVVNCGDADKAAQYIATAMAPRDITEIPLQRGRMLLCTWAVAPARPDRGILAVVDGTAGSPEVAVPTALIDTDGIPAGLLNRISQDRSYLYLDEARSLAFLTDHIGTSRIYHVQAAGCDVFSDNLAVLARLAPEPDEDCLAFFLTNGATFMDRTLHAGLSALPVASIVTLADTGPAARRYWNFRPGQDADPDTDAVSRGLWDRIESAVAAHTAGRQIVLPLSGGHDSTTLLGILHRSGAAITAFSYVNGEPQPHSDAAVAREQARRLGVAHTTYRIDGTDTLSLIRQNLAQGLRLRGCCNEIGAYRDAAAAAREKFADPLFVFGDHLFGQRTLRLKTATDMLGGAAVKHPDTLLAYVPLLGAERVSGLQRTLAADYRRLLDAAPPFEHPDDLKDYLYSSVSATWDLLPMRVHTAGTQLPYTTPLYDIAMLDFLKHLHFSHRLDKRLFRQVCERKLPELFSQPRSRDRQGVSDVASALRRDAPAIREVSSTLDGVIPGLALPGGFDAMLDTVLASRPPPPGGPLLSRPEAFGLQFFRNLTRLQVLPLHWLQPIKRRFWNTHQILLDPAYMFRRVLHLAMGFQQLGPPIRPPEP
ncbi:asparagine synthase-related protein [Emcibacter sp. SYSU 3D8]|uniref:asparagine synthase-related protein n=1 Tax=Emcibacter sp. SYSU 3D8 TaxID=3133969 RepID=UPI0031FF31B8